MQIIDIIPVGMPIGTVLGYTGVVAALPFGWFVMDGNNGTVNIGVNQLIKGASNQGDIGNNVGNSTSGTSSSHSHTVSTNNTNISSSTYPSHTHGWTANQGNADPDGAGDRISAGNSQSYPRQTAISSQGITAHRHGTSNGTSSKSGHSHSITDVQYKKMTLIQRVA
jgi:hypothetical protein